MPGLTARETDLNGYLIVRGCPLSREGIYEYSAKQINPNYDPQNPDRIVKVFRPAEEIFAPEAIESFKSVPLIDEHAMMNGIGGKHPEYAAPEDKGIDGVLTDNIWYDESDGWLKGDLKLFSRRLQQTILNKDDLSLGFGCLFYVEPGTWNGEEYEIVQRRIRGNHLAVVDDGRIDGARILDAMCFDSVNLDLLTYQKTEEIDMQKGIKPVRIIKGSAADSALEKLKSIIPALQAIVAEGQTEVGGTAAAAPVDNAEPAADPAVAPAAEPAAVPDAADPEVAAAPESGAEPADPAVETSAEPAADPAQKPEDVMVLVQQVEALVAQIKDMCAPAPAAEPAAATDSDLPDENAAAMDTEVTGAMAAVDSVEPEQEMVTDNCDTTGASSAGLPKGSIDGSGQDSSLKAFYADNVKKNKLYARLSKVVGVFECAAMDSREVAAYGVKKLGLQCKKGQEVDAVDLYLNGLAKGQKLTAEAAAIESAAMDSRTKCAELDAWLQESK